MADKIEALIAEKNEAVANEDYMRAAELKTLIEAAGQELIDAKNKAVEDEDYMLAAELKKKIEELNISESGGGPKKTTPRSASSMSSSSSSTSALKSPTSRGTTTESSSAFDQSSPSKSSNPIKSDPELKAMIDKLDSIGNFRAFKQWKSSFLNRFEEFLDEAGSQPAQAAYSEFRTNTGAFVKQVKKVQSYVENGDISTERTSVKGRNSLNEMNKRLVALITEEENLIPSKSAEEKERGYTKFHLGAVLVRDGFKEYERMNTCCDILNRLKETSLSGVADKLQLEEIDNYDRQMKRFRDLMADLGLYEVMMKCWEFGEEGEEFIFVDLKTGAVGGIGIKHCIDKGFVHTIKDAKGSDTGFRQAITDEEDKEAILDLVKETLKL